MLLSGSAQWFRERTMHPSHHPCRCGCWRICHKYLQYRNIYLLFLVVSCALALPRGCILYHVPCACNYIPLLRISGKSPTSDACSPYCGCGCASETANVTCIVNINKNCSGARAPALPMHLHATLSLCAPQPPKKEKMVWWLCTLLGAA